MNKPHAIISKIGAMRSAPAAIVAFTCLSLLVDNIAYSIAFAFLPHIFDDMRLASESQLGIVTTLYGVGTFITSIISGIVSDRIGRRKPLMLIGAVGYGISGIVLFFSYNFWHILVYKLVNGLASGCIYPLSIAIIGDVYPQKLLGLKMSFIQVFGNLGYMVGPLIGGALYDKVGVHGSATLLMLASGFLSFVLAFGIKDPLTIRAEILANHTVSVVHEVHEKLDMDEYSDVPSARHQSYSDSPVPVNMPLWKLICQWQVLSASVVTLTIGILSGSLDSIQPMRAKDKFHASASKNGLLFVTNGVISLVLSMPVGCAVDWLIGRYGERTRMWIVLTGLILTGSAVMAMGFSSSFDMILGIQAWLSISLLLVNIPVMSSFGDFVNALGLNSMAQSYCVYNAAWAMALMGAPPLATFLYTQLGYKAMVSGVLVGLFILCTVLVLGGSIWQKYRLLAHRSTS